MATFGGGITTISDFGQQDQMAFSGTWVVNEHWSWALAATEGDITVGLGVWNGLTATCLLKLKNRMFVGLTSRFAFSDNDDPTAFEEQAPGAGFVDYLTQYGAQDAIVAMAIMQGRLVVFGSKTIQIWSTDADPANFSLVQVLDNLGTISRWSVNPLGDLDVPFLDASGYRSLRARETTLNAEPEDIGTPIDSLVQADIVAGGDPASNPGIVDPISKRYWHYLNGKIYVYSHFPNSKIFAWSTYLPTYSTLVGMNSFTYSGSGTARLWVSNSTDPATSVLAATTAGPPATSIAILGRYLWVTVDTAAQPTSAYMSDTHVENFVGQISYDQGSNSFTLNAAVQTTFTPQKMVVYNKQVYIRSTSGKIYVYGGTNNNTYDNCVPTAATSWLDDKTPGTQKLAEAIAMVASGRWMISCGTDPQSGTMTDIAAIAPPESTPSAKTDSPFDTGQIPFSSQGSHFRMKATGQQTVGPMLLSSLIYYYNMMEKKT